MNEAEKYHVNFFKPHSPHAKANTKIIIILASIWAVGVFGFQILQMVISKPTPEKNYTVFESVWPKIVNNSGATQEDRQQFSRVILSVLGKNVAVKAPHKDILKKTFSWNVYTMMPDTVQAVLKTGPTAELYPLVKEKTGLADGGMDKIMADIIPYALVKVESAELSADCKKTVPEIMKLYLIHNQSALTDFTFIGFPFHYWYTAQFMLILFVMLCLVYALVIERINKKYGFVEET